MAAHVSSMVQDFRDRLAIWSPRDIDFDLTGMELGGL